MKRARFNVEDKVKVTPDIIESDGTVETLRQQFDVISALVSNAADGLYTVDSQGHFTFINPAAEQMLGWPAASYLGGTSTRLSTSSISMAHPARRKNALS